MSTSTLLLHRSCLRAVKAIVAAWEKWLDAQQVSPA